MATTPAPPGVQHLERALKLNAAATLAAAIIGQRRDHTPDQAAKLTSDILDALGQSGLI